MNERTLRILEYDKILKLLGKYAQGKIAKDKISVLVPETNPVIIERALSDTSDGVELILRKSNPPMTGTRDVRDSVLRASKGSVLLPEELINIATVLRGVRQLKDYAKDEKEAFSGNAVCSLADSLETYKELESEIGDIVISETEISDFASSELSKIRNKIRRLQTSIKEKLNKIISSSSNQKLMQDSIITMRGDRYVIPVKSEYKNDFPGIVHDVSSSGATFFIEPMAVVEANNDIKRETIKEEQEVERILYEISAQVALISDSLIQNVNIIGEIDFIFAKAKLSLDMNAISPKVSLTGFVDIIKGRHPLIKKDVVVPIDVRLGKDFRILVITGPNTGGKTVTLKTLGLLSLMAQAGLHIPAKEESSLRIFNDIFADIGDEQSIEQSLSTFSSHMKNIVEIIKIAKENSLVLLDELGAGTDPTEGAALATSILEHMRHKGLCVAATTHYSELKIYAIKTEGVENACCEFSTETLQPTYKLLIGVPGRSNAFAISSKLGLKDIIIQKAHLYLSEDNIKFEEILGNIEADRSEAKMAMEEAARYKSEAEKLRDELANEKKSISKKKNDIISDGYDEARLIVANAREEAKEIIAELQKIRNSEMSSMDKSDWKRVEELRRQLKSSEDEYASSLSKTAFVGRTNSPLRKNGVQLSLKEGDLVHVISMDKEGIVIKTPQKNRDGKLKGQALVQIGAIKANIDISDIEAAALDLLSKSDASGAGLSYNSSGMTNITRTISQEIDVRGLNVDEAIPAIDKYIDDACVAGLHSVVIIHGKGTGMLRSGVQIFLKKDKRVKGFRLGTFGEGETGVTIAELK